jgi:hypothetical protein
MHERIARTLRFLARLSDQHISRNNAAGGGATLRRRRLDRGEVDEYLQGRTTTVPAAVPRVEGRGEHGAERTL